MTTPTHSRIAARINVPDRAVAYEIVNRHPLDYGCKPSLVPAGDGYYVPAVLTPDDVVHLRDKGIDVDLVFDYQDGDRSAAATVGRDDRFDGGKRSPRGAGTSRQPDDVGPIMNVDEIGSAVTGLANEYDLPTIGLPNSTAEGRDGTALGAPKVDPELYHVYFTAGVHARERGGPDALIYFIADLLYADTHNIPVTYGARSYSPADVRKALNTGIVFFPLVNPDGVAWDQKTDTLWRKNRNPAGEVPNWPSSIGVDINRNYDFLWDFRRHFDPAASASTSLASDDPRIETFHGVAPFSEPESKNVAWIYDQFPRLNWYVDIHSAVGTMLYSWGDDDDQSGDPAETFLDPRFDGQRGALLKDDYREWIPEADLGRVKRVARRTTSAMAAVGGRTYTSKPSADLYATSGAGDDYAYSRCWADGGRSKVHGFTMEFGYPTNFYPTLTEFHQNLVDVGAGLLEFCLAAADNPV